MAWRDPAGTQSSVCSHLTLILMIFISRYLSRRSAVQTLVESAQLWTAQPVPSFAPPSGTVSGGQGPVSYDGTRRVTEEWGGGGEDRLHRGGDVSHTLGTRRTLPAALAGGLLTQVESQPLPCW